jgi:5-hydroxyisourate hydrolase
MRVVLRRVGQTAMVAAAVLNADGRVDAPLLEGAAMQAGEWELEFHLGEYFRGRGVESPFLEVVPVRFLIEAGQSYHVPLVCSPWAYQTYRGS